MITSTIVLGGLRAPQAKTWDGVLDLTTEFTANPHPNYLSLPVLDMTVPSPAVVRTALDWIAQQPKDAVICVHCALGLSRSATIVAAWMVYTKQAPNAREAFIQLRQLRPVVWGNAHEQLVDQFK
jgi:protein-tyrosine phosphatase